MSKFDVDRRRFLKAFVPSLGWGLAAPYVLSVTGCGGELDSSELTFGLTADDGRVFDLSVASGDPSQTGVALWTHIRPSSFSPTTPLRFQVATDAAFASLVLEGMVAAPATGPSTDYTVKVDLEGRLGAGRGYFYRFVYGDVASRTGRCRTLPAAGAGAVKLGLLTCQDFTNGYYGAYRHVAADDSLDFLVHLGDFIYESVEDPRFQDLPFPDRQLTLPGGGTVALGLDDYRFLYRSYRSDPALQRALERHTLIAAPDDHETANDCYWDYARDTLGAPDHPFKDDVARLKRLKLDSQRAWLEYVPARVPFNASATHPHQASRVYREFNFGDLVRLCMLDTRTYRSPHPCGEGDFFHRYVPVGCGTLNAPTQTILGSDQRTWLVDRLSAKGATWKLLGNQTFLGRMSALPGGALPINVDAWDGYAAERKWLSNELGRRQIKNLVVATGDLHSTIASYVKASYDNINPLDLGNLQGVEFMTPAVTSAALTEMLGKGLGGAGSFTSGLGAAAVRLNNPHIRYFDSSRHGYSTLQFTRSSCEWVAYAVDKGQDASVAGKQAYARFRKDTNWPFLIEGSTRDL
jgi:alkaline phosphatase D